MSLDSKMFPSFLTIPRGYLPFFFPSQWGICKLFTQNANASELSLGGVRRVGAGGESGMGTAGIN